MTASCKPCPSPPYPCPTQPEYVPLLRDHEILSQPSASAIAVSRQQLKGRHPAAKQLAILADPVYRADDSRVTHPVTARPAAERIAQQPSLPIELNQHPARPRPQQPFKPCPTPATEADFISQLVPADQRTAVYDFDANYDWVTSPQLSQYQIVHLATHGFVNPTNPELSGIVLAPSSTAKAKPSTKASCACTTSSTSASPPNSSSSAPAKPDSAAKSAAKA